MAIINDIQNAAIEKKSKPIFDVQKDIDILENVAVKPLRNPESKLLAMSRILS
jgi:hypothetical protein